MLPPRTVHHLSVGVGQDQRGYLAQGHAHCRIDIKECLHYAEALWADTLGAQHFRYRVRLNSLVLSHIITGSGILESLSFHNPGLRVREVFFKSLLCSLRQDERQTISRHPFL